MIVSLRSNEISDQKAFKKFISEVLDLTKNPEKLIKVLFGNLAEKLSDEKKSSLSGYIKNIIAETDDSKRDHQMKFLQKIVNEISNTNQTSRNSF
jgi:hydrogenase maturation factor HypE